MVSMDKKKNLSKGTVREKNSAETKTAILNAALRLFSEFGYAGVPLRTIADEVGVNHAMIRYYFGGKKELWQAAAKFLFAKLNNLMLETQERLVNSELSPRDQAKEFIRVYVQYCARHPEHSRIMIQESISASDRSETIASFVAMQHENVFKVFEAWMDAGFITRMPYVSLAYALAGMSQTLFVLANEVKNVHGIDITTQDAVDAHCETVINLFFNE